MDARSAGTYSLGAMYQIEVKRHLGADDLPGLTGLLAAASDADGHPALGEHAWLDLVQGGREAFAGLVAWEHGHPHPVGYAHLSRGGPATGYAGHARGDRPSWALEVVVDPHHRTPGNSVAVELLQRALKLIAAEGGGHLHLWVSQPTPQHASMAAAAGLSPGRALYQMRRALPVAERPTIAVRGFRVGQDEEAWLELNNRAFAWHPEQGGWTELTLKARESQGWFDPEGFLLHERDGKLAGFCWTKVHHSRGADMGELYVLAVAPELTGRGLGRQLVLAGLDYLGRKDLTEAMLYVDATNAAAVRLYVDLGFTVDHTDRAYTGDIAAER